MAIETVTMPVHGMTCGGCVRTVEKKLSGTPGVAKVTVDLAGASATVEYDPSAVRPEALANAVRQLGFEVPA
jgi:copper chaperone CopZ